MATRRAGPVREFLLTSGIAAVIVAALAWLVTPMNLDHAAFAKAGDHHKYVYMAETDMPRFHVAPFCWRIGVPSVVKTLTRDVEAGFRLVTLVSLWATGVVVYYLARWFSADAAAGLFGMLAFFGTGWATKYPLFDYWLPDPAALLIVAAAMYCILRGWTAAFAVLLAAGVTVKESVIFVAPLYFTLIRPGLGWRPRLVRGAAAIIPAIVVLAAIRLAIPGRNGDARYMRTLPERLTQVDEGRTSYEYGEQLGRISLERARDLSARTLVALHSYSVGSLGVLPLAMALFAVGPNLRMLARLSPFVILVYGQLVFATDTQRLLVLSWPAVSLMMLNGLAALTRSWKVGAVWLLPIPAMVILLSLWNANRVAGPSWAEASILAVCLVLILGFRRGLQT